MTRSPASEFERALDESAATRATTRQLLVELKARLESLPGSMLDYRTVDGDAPGVTATERITDIMDATNVRPRTDDALEEAVGDVI